MISKKKVKVTHRKKWWRQVREAGYAELMGILKRSRARAWVGAGTGALASARGCPRDRQRIFFQKGTLFWGADCDFLERESLSWL